MKKTEIADIGKSGVYVEKISFDSLEREDLGYIFMYETSQFSVEIGSKPFRMDEEYIYFTVTFLEKGNESEKIYKYSLSGQDESEVILEEPFEGRYNKDGKVLGYDVKDEEKEFYLYDDKEKVKYTINNSGLDADKLSVLKKASDSLLQYYVDDKYIYIYEPLMINGTLIFDTRFKYIGIFEGNITATIGDNLMCVMSDDFITVKRDDILNRDKKVCMLIENKSGIKYEWMENL